MTRRRNRWSSEAIRVYDKQKLFYGFNTIWDTKHSNYKDKETVFVGIFLICVVILGVVFVENAFVGIVFLAVVVVFVVVELVIVFAIISTVRCSILYPTLRPSNPSNPSVRPLIAPRC